jgi:hypothetical protein
VLDSRPQGRSRIYSPIKPANYRLRTLSEPNQQTYGDYQQNHQDGAGYPRPRKIGPPPPAVSAKQTQAKSKN